MFNIERTQPRADAAAVFDARIESAHARGVMGDDERKQDKMFAASTLPLLLPPPPPPSPSSTSGLAL